MNPQEFVNKYSGQTKGYPTDKDYPGECLSIVKLYIKEVFDIDAPPSGSNSAYGYWQNFPDPLPTIFEKISNAPGVVPLPGDIPIWKPTADNSFGHIDICISASVNSSKFTGFDQNWGSKEAHIQIHNYNNVVGWLHPKEEPMPDPNCDPEDANRLRNCRGDRDQIYIALGIPTDSNVDVALKKLQEIKDRIESVGKQCEIDKKTISERLDEFKSTNLILEGEKNKVYEALGLAKDTPVDKVLKKIESLGINQLESMTGGELIVAGIKKLLEGSKK
jgi:hypothetical protein